MRRIMTIATLVVFAQAVASFSATALQAPGTTTPLRRIQVNAQTIQAVAKGKKYVVDLTQRGTKYEFDPRAGQLDFSRVVVLTAQGEVAIGSFLQTKFLKEKLAGFKYTSQAFSLVTRPPGTAQRLPRGTSNFNCGPDLCSCQGERDCTLMFTSITCSEVSFCAIEPITGQIFCACEAR